MILQGRNYSRETLKEKLRRKPHHHPKSDFLPLGPFKPSIILCRMTQMPEDYNRTTPAPTNIATVIYAAILRNPKSKAGIVTIPAAPLLVEEPPEPEPELPLPEPERPVAAGALVIVPVPAAPAWLIMALQLDAGLGLTF